MVRRIRNNSCRCLGMLVNILAVCECEYNYRVVMEWISVNDRLPEEEGDYLTHWAGSSYRPNDICYYNSKLSNQFDTSGWVLLRAPTHEANPTHWMPLPEPPKE